MDEADRIRDAYARRAGRGADDRYSLTEPHNLYLFQRRERDLLALLRRQRLTPLADKRVLDVGCGNGEVLRDFVRYGADPARLAGVDLLASRLKAARSRSPNIACAVADAASLPYRDATFDVALQFTLLSSVLDPSLRRRIAAETLRVLRPSGVLIFYDFIWNPGNRDVRGLGLRDVRALYPGCALDAQRTTLAPPISRRLVRLAWPLAALAEAAPFLRSHHLIAIRKPG